MHVHLPRLDIRELQHSHMTKMADITNETSVTVRERVALAQNIQLKRQKKLNSKLNQKDLNLYCILNKECEELLAKAGDKLHLSARAYHRVVKLARTIADLSASKSIDITHISEALSFRSN